MNIEIWLQEMNGFIAWYIEFHKSMFQKLRTFKSKNKNNRKVRRVMQVQNILVALPLTDWFIAGSLEAAYSLNWGAREIWGKGGGETLALLW